MQAAAYAGAAWKIGSTLSNHPTGTVGPTPGIVSGINPGPQPMSGNRASNSVLMAAYELLGVSHLPQLTIVVEGTQITSYKHFHLS